MDYITIDVDPSTGCIFDIGALYEALAEVRDKRHNKGKRYTVELLISVVVLAKLSGEDTPYGISEWAKLRSSQLQRLFRYHRPVCPSNKTLQRLADAAVEDDDVQQVIRRYLHQTYGGQQSILITIDGKTLRGTIPAGKTSGVHLLAAYLPEEGIVLLQIEVESKENEISAAPKLLTQLDLKGRVVSGDAMFTQRDISVAVLAGNGDYLWFVKDNQPTLHADVQRFFQDTTHASGWHPPTLPETIAEETVKQSGRIETRRLTAMPNLHDYVQWPGLKTVFKLERHVHVPSKDETRTQVVFGITSLPYAKQIADHLLAWTRQHWAIENGLHYRRDVTLNEDATRMKSSKQAKLVATFNNFVIALTTYMGFSNLRSARRFFQAKLDTLLFAVS